MVVALDTSWAIKTEATYGTPISLATGGKVIPFTSESITQNREYIEVPNSRARVQPYSSNLGRKSVSGNVDFWVDAESIIAPLFYTMGTAAAAQDAVTTAYDHTNTFNLEELKTFTSELRYGGSGTKAKIVTSCISSGLSIDFAESAVSASMGIVAKSINNAGTVTWPGTHTNYPRPFVYKDAALSIGGSNVTTLVSANLNIANDVVDDYRQGQTDSQSLSAGLADFTGSMTLVYDSADATAITDFFDGTASDLVFTYTGDTNGIETGKAYTLTSTIPRALCSASAPVQSTAELITRTVEFRGFYDHTQGTEPARGPKIVVKNKTTTAYS